MPKDPTLPLRRQSTPPAVSHAQPSSARIVWLRIALSAHHLSAHEDLECRLCALLRRTGISCWMTDRALLLMAGERRITAADWSAVIGWLLCQPEVVFVARELPLTRQEVQP